MTYRREAYLLTDEDIAEAVARYVRERRPPKPGVPFCWTCRDRRVEPPCPDCTRRRTRADTVSR